MRQVLFIAYYFPPTGGGGVQRTVKFAKYLEYYDWRAFVLTGCGNAGLEDPSLVDDISPDSKVLRAKGITFPKYLPRVIQYWISRWILIVDAQLGWLPAAVRSGLKIIRENNIDAIYSTSAPYTDHLVAWEIKKRTGLPWLADFRDPWTANINANFPTRIHQRICFNLERRIILNADRVISVSDPMRKQFTINYPNVPDDRFVTITNGYDLTDLDIAKPTAALNDHFSLVYTGSIYGHRTARYILQAIHNLITDAKVDTREIRLRFVGNCGRETVNLVKQLNMSEVVEFLGYVPHSDVSAYHASATVLLLLIAGRPGNDVVLTGKLFEYLAARKPILALIPVGAARDLLLEAGAGKICDPDDIQAIELAIIEMLSLWRSGELKGDIEYSQISRYDRRVLAGVLADYLNAIAF